jgi:ribonuclease HI/probable phosphoglycerate mutase
MCSIKYLQIHKTMNKFFKLPAISQSPTATSIVPTTASSPRQTFLENDNIVTITKKTPVKHTQNSTRVSKVVNSSRQVSQNKVSPIASDDEEPCTLSEERTGSYVMYFDGCSKGNPGRAGAGAVIYHNGQEVWAQSIYVGDKQTNNYAEYAGLMLGLEGALKLNVMGERFSVFGDSSLVINQLNGKYKINSENLANMHRKSMEYVSQFKNITFQHVYRTENARADQLANEGISVSDRVSDQSVSVSHNQDTIIVTDDDF